MLNSVLDFTKWSILTRYNYFIIINKLSLMHIKIWRLLLLLLNFINSIHQKRHSWNQSINLIFLRLSHHFLFQNIRWTSSSQTQRLRLWWQLLLVLLTSIIEYLYGLLATTTVGPRMIYRIIVCLKYSQVFIVIWSHFLIIFWNLNLTDQSFNLK